MRRGQLVFDLFLTYGAAIIIMVAVLGVLAWYGILKVENFSSDQCTSIAGLSCTGWKLTKWSEGSVEPEVAFNIRNDFGGAITLIGGSHKLTCPDCPEGHQESGTKCSYYNYPDAEPGEDFTLRANQKVQLSCNPDESRSIDFKRVGEKQKVYFEFEYLESGSRYPQRASGLILARVEAQAPIGAGGGGGDPPETATPPETPCEGTAGECETGGAVDPPVSVEPVGK